MEKLSNDKRVRILACLVEGTSIASTARITGSAPNSILKTLREAGEACSAYHDEHMRDLPCKAIQLDEIWSFIGCKENHKDRVKGSYMGDVWMWTAICADTKIIPSWRIGDRGAAVADDFCADLAERFAGRIQITSDGWNAYERAIRRGFGAQNVDYAQMVKIYEKGRGGRNVVKGIEKRVVLGAPDLVKASTSYVERSNLMIRATNKRYARLTTCYSKKVENHAHQVAISFMAYNFCRKHDSLKGQTPAQAAGISEHRWSMEDVVAMVDGYHAKKQADAFEAAFEARYAKHREFPKSYPPTPKDQIPVPWYLDVNSGGPPSEKGLTE